MRANTKIMYNIVSALADLATAQDWHGILSFSDTNTNTEVTGALTIGATVFVYDAVARPQIRNGRVVGVAADVVCALWKKFDAGYDGTNGATTSANLDETHAQKYARRLADLYAELVDALAAWSCDEQADIVFSAITPEVNAYDENFDGWVVRFSFNRTE